MTSDTHEIVPTGGVPLHCWTRGVPVEDAAREQLARVARLPIVFRHLAMMPDVHVGRGAAIGAVIPTVDAVIPAAVGVDLGCGVCAAPTTLRREDLPAVLHPLRVSIENAIPHGRTANGGRGDRGAWGRIPAAVHRAWEQELATGHAAMIGDDPHLRRANAENHLGTLGTGNHFLELCLDAEGAVWLLLHSGSRGIGNALATHFIRRAQATTRRRGVALADPDLAWLAVGEEDFNSYLAAAAWAQRYARINRALLLDQLLAAVGGHPGVTAGTLTREPIDCHHNYVAREEHFGRQVWVTRKGAVRAGAGEAGIIPGSMGARSFIVRGRGEPLSFLSCSHGAGRCLSRTAAKRRFTVRDHTAATAGIECRRDAEVLDETPGAYKDIDAVMAAQADLVEVVAELRQILCVKG